MLLKTIALLAIGFISVEAATRTFNTPSTYFGTGSIYKINKDNTFTETDNFTEMKASLELNLVLNSIGIWKTDANNVRVKHYTEQNF